MIKMRDSLTCGFWFKMGGFNQDFVDSGQMRVLEEVGADQIWILQNVDRSCSCTLLQIRSA